MQLEGIEVNIPTHPESGDVFERYEILQEPVGWAILIRL